jgi:transcriptional regulator with XRE-family HTH domain
VDVAARFGENLARLRKEASMTQDDLAAFSTVNRANISELERGLKQPRLDTLVKLAWALEVSPNALTEGIEWIPGEPGREKRGGRYRDDRR